MENKYYSSKNFRKVPAGPVAKNIRIKFENLEDSVFSQFQLLSTLARCADSWGIPKKHEALSQLALSMVELLETIKECAEEYDSLIPDEGV
jgi:hypothetical protein